MVISILSIGWYPGVSEDGLTRAEFSAYLQARAQYVNQRWPNTTKPRDVAEAFKWFYADWPYINDTERNREMVGRVG